MHFTTSSDPYTVTEQFKKNVLWGGGGGREGGGEEVGGRGDISIPPFHFQ